MRGFGRPTGILGGPAASFGDMSNQSFSRLKISALYVEWHDLPSTAQRGPDVTLTLIMVGNDATAGHCGWQSVTVPGIGKLHRDDGHFMTVPGLSELGPNVVAMWKWPVPTNTIKSGTVKIG